MHNGYSWADFAEKAEYNDAPEWSWAEEKAHLQAHGLFLIAGLWHDCLPMA